MELIKTIISEKYINISIILSIVSLGSARPIITLEKNIIIPAVNSTTWNADYYIRKNILSIYIINIYVLHQYNE